MPPDCGGVKVAEVNADEVRPEEHDDDHGAFQAEHAFGKGVEGDVEDAVEVGDGVHGAHQDLEDEGEGAGVPYAGVEVKDVVLRGVGPAVEVAPGVADACEGQLQGV